MRFLLLSIVFFGSYLHADVATRKISFDPPNLISNGRGTSYRPGLREQGFYLSHPPAQAYGGMYVQPHLYPFSPVNGSNYARFISGGQNLSVVHEQALPFTPLSVDLSGGSSTFLAQGIKAGGAIVSTTFSLGTNTGFQTFAFPSTFADIIELKFPGTNYYMDDLVVIPPAIENLPPVNTAYVYDIDWNSSPHHIGQMTALGGKRSPSSVNFGTAYVRNGIGALTGPALELQQGEDTYDQIEMALGLNAESYFVEFDICQPSAGNMSLFLDLTAGFLRIDFSNGSISYFNGTSGVITDAPTNRVFYNPKAATRVRVSWDKGARGVEIGFNDVEELLWTVPAGVNIDFRAIRFSTSSTSVTGIDNVKVDASGRSPLHLIPGHFDFQSTTLTGIRSTPVFLLNTTQSPITITGSSVTNAAFSLTGLSYPLIIPPSGTVTATLSTTSQLYGSMGSNVTFTSASGNAAMQVQATGPTATPTGSFTASPESSWVGIERKLTLTSTFVGAPRRFEWTKNGSVIPSNLSSFTLNSAQLKDAGVYQVKAIFSDGTSVSSLPANVGVYNDIRSIGWVQNSGSFFGLSSPSAGPNLTYAWTKDGQALPGSLPNIVMDGANIRFTPLLNVHQGYYVAEVSMPNAAGGSALKVSIAMDLVVRQPPILITASLGQAMVGVEYDQELLFRSYEPLIVEEIVGLPPGLKYHGTPPRFGYSWEYESGSIGGIPLPEAAPATTSSSAPSLYLVKIRARNAQGTGEWKELPLWVHPTSRSASFSGLSSFDRQFNRGGRLQVTVTSGGLCTALFDDGLSQVRVAKMLSFDQSSGEMRGSIYQTNPRYLSWDFRLQEGRQILSTISFGGRYESMVAGICLHSLIPAQQTAGSYPTALIVNTNDTQPGLNAPTGAGVLQARLGRTAQMSCVGVLPDGSTITSSGQMVANWDDSKIIQYPFFSRTSIGNSLLTGWLFTSNGLMDGRLAWSRMASAFNASYTSGFSFNSSEHWIQAIGGTYIMPGSGSTLLNLHTQPQILRASSWDIKPPTDYSRRFNIDTRYRTSPLGPATRQATLVVTPANSSFSGTLEIGSYLGKPLIGKYRGLLVPRLGRGVGFMLRPKMVKPVENARTSRPSIIVPYDSVAIDLAPESED